MSAQDFIGSLRTAPIQERVRFTESGVSHWSVRTSISGRGRDDTLFFPFFFSFASVREPSGDRLVTQRPWVSTREYGGWNRARERGRSGDMPEMVKKKQRDATSATECRHSFSLCCFFRGDPQLKEIAAAVHSWVKPAFFHCPRWSKFVFFLFFL